MSFIHQFQSINGKAPLSRRRALLGLSILALAYYTCTMHPFVRSQDPDGKCPVCGMNLVPVLKSTPNNSATNAAPIAATSTVDESGMVNIAPERMQEIGATTEVVTKRALTLALRAPARAEIDESALRDINVKAGSGYITKLYASYEGMSFRKGQPLMTVLCEGWLQTQIDYIKAYRDWKRTPLMSPNNSFALDNKLELASECGTNPKTRFMIWKTLPSAPMRLT
jgi:Cu(I)/Ag(I) efflux system membrane fusion protein